MQLFDLKGIEEIPVVESQGGPWVLGMLRRRDVIAAYNHEVLKRGYGGALRQIVIRGNGREKPAFLITNGFETPVELLVGNYARRWRVENGIAAAVKFFHLNALSSPILVK